MRMPLLPRMLDKPEVRHFASDLRFGFRLLRRAPTYTAIAVGLKSGSLASGRAAGAVRLRGLLVVAGTALAVVLLAAASLLVRSLLAVRSVDPGFGTRNVLTVRASLPSGASAARRLTFNDELQQRLRTVPAVSRVGAIDALFALGTLNNLGFRAIEGRDLSERRQDWLPMKWNPVSGDYFEAIGIPLLRGRPFSSHDGADSPLVAIVDESTVRRMPIRCRLPRPRSSCCPS